MAIRLVNTSLVVVALSSSCVLGAKAFNSGFDDGSSSRLANDVADSDWRIADCPDPSFVGVMPLVRVSPLPGLWMADAASTESRWITAARVGDNSLDLSPGIWVFETTVDLVSGGDAHISNLRYAADNKLVGITINGILVFQQPEGFAEEFLIWHTLGDVGSGLFRPGKNVIRFSVLNESGWNNPVGIRVEGTVIPEPACATLWAVGCLISAARRRRC